MARKTQDRRKIEADEVIDQLERVVRWSDEFRLAFVKCNHPRQCEAMRRTLLERLHDRRVLEIFLEQPILSLLDELTARWDAANPPHAICVYGLEKSIDEQREAAPVLGRLNHDRDLLRRAVPAALLIWLPDFALDCVARGAPDFWAWRSGVYEFATDTQLWQTDSVAALTSNAPALFSLSLEDKQREIRRLEELLRAARALPQQGKREQQTVADLLYQLGLLYQSLGELDRAWAQYEESLAISRRLGNQAGIAVSLHELGRVQQEQGNLAEAERLYRQSLQIKEELGDKGGTATTLWALGLLQLQQGRPREALRHFAAAWELWRTLHSPYATTVLTRIKELREQVGKEQFRAWLVEDFGSHAAPITEALDKEVISSP
jgi:tetratricopeptide (TPR) repeat protein